MRACIQCGETGGTRIGGPCISCVFDDSDCDELVAAARKETEEQTAVAIVAWLKKEFRHTIRSEVLDAIWRGDWKAR